MQDTGNGLDREDYCSGYTLYAFNIEPEFVPSELIHLYGDWSSDAYKKYLRFKLDDKITVYNTHTRFWICF
jgi:hypothetical protein